MSMYSVQASEVEVLGDPAATVRRAAFGVEPQVLTEIHQQQVNMAVWQRQVSGTLAAAVAALLEQPSQVQAVVTVTPDRVLDALSTALGDERADPLKADIAELVAMFCCLFDLKRAGLRLRVLDRAMCPKFHVDQVPCRLVTSYYGVGTQWLSHESVDRQVLSRRDHAEAELVTRPDAIGQLSCGDVALLKGERWEGNEHAGLVHRSPALVAPQRRLLLTLDFSD